MVTVVCMRCFHYPCEKRPSFNAERSKMGDCIMHAEAGMVAVRNKRFSLATCAQDDLPYMSLAARPWRNANGTEG